MLAFCAACATATAPALADQTVPQQVRDAVKTLAAQRHGALAFQRHYVYDQRAPGRNELVKSEFDVVRDDGRVVAVKLYRRTKDGDAATPDDIAKRQAELDKELPDEDYAPPIVESALADYTFGAQAPCDNCSDDVVAIPFTSRKRDDDHGDGIVYVDERNHRFVRLRFHPSALPKDADSGEIEITFGRALADLWDVVAEKQTYTGHLLFIHGGATITIVQNGYRRFDSLEAARSAVAAGL